jgi:hypothetical protein
LGVTLDISWKIHYKRYADVLLGKQEMNTRKGITLLGLLAVIGIVVGGIGFAVAQDTAVVDDLGCDGTGPLGVLNGRGFWGQLSEEQGMALYDEAQLMYGAGATHEEVQAMKVEMLESWGVDAPLWGGPHVGGQGGGYGKMARDGLGSGGQYGGRGAGGRGNNGACPQTN